jgi:DNA-binding NarL/FixJ family response regulator
MLLDVTNVLIFDERRSARDALTALVRAVPCVDRIDCVTSGEGLLAQFDRQRPDLVVIGTQRALTSGIEATRRLLAFHPSALVVVFGSREDTASIAAAMVCGAQGFLRWDTTQPQLMGALTNILTTRRLSSRITTVRHAVEGGKTLTERELQVLQGMSRGRSNGEIGRELYLSEDTVKSHASQLFRKLGTHGRAQSVAQGFRQGLVA